MGHLTRLAGSGLLLVAASAALTACSQGDLAFSNEGAEDVTVSTQDAEFEVSAGGGVVILESGCSEGDITVVFASGREIVVAGPVCPDERVLIQDGNVVLQPAR